MQYKIPVQIENEDPIIFNLSLRQISILIAGGSIAYLIYTGLFEIVGPELALVPSGIIFIITLLIVYLKVSEMTFLPFILNFIRQYINGGTKKWIKGIDSFQSIDIGYITKLNEKKEKNIMEENKEQKLEKIKEKIDNI